MQMSKLSGWIVDGLATLVLGYIFKQFAFPLTKALAVNAMLGWIDDKIGEVFGITAQTAVSWAIAFGLAALILYLYHIIQVRFFREQIDSTSKKTAQADLHQSRPPEAKSDQKTQPGFTTHATAKVLPPARYSKAQINRILEAIDAIYPSLTDLEQALVFGTWTAGSLEANIRDQNRGAQFVLSEMDKLRLRIIGPSESLDKAADQYSLYREACQPISDRTSFKDAFFDSYNQLAQVLREIPEQLSATALTMFVDAKKKTFITRIAEYLIWAQRQKKALSEYREYYLRHETTD